MSRRRNDVGRDASASKFTCLFCGRPLVPVQQSVDRTESDDAPQPQGAGAVAASRAIILPAFQPPSLLASRVSALRPNDLPPEFVYRNAVASNR